MTQVSIIGNINADIIARPVSALPAPGTEHAIDSIECIGGSLSKTQSRLVEAWAELHREELLSDWELLQSGRPPTKIAPLQ